MRPLVVVSGYTSKIADELWAVSAQRGIQPIWLRVGRGQDADYPVDFSSLSSIRSFIQWFQDVKATHLFLNHGILSGQKIAVLDEAAIFEAVQVNLLSFTMILESLEDRGNLNTVVMSSISGKIGSFDTLYSVCKAGIDALVRGIAPKIPPSSRLNAISPGIIEDAGMTLRRQDLDVLENKRKQAPTQQFTTSQEVASMVHYLLFESRNVSGQNININGGIF